MLGANYVHNNLARTIEDIGALDRRGNEVYIIGNPGEGIATIDVPVRRRRRRFADAEAEAAVRRARAHAQPPLLEQLVRSASYTLQPAVRQLLRALANSDEIPTPTTGVVVGHGAAAGGSIARAGQQRQPRVGHRRARCGIRTATSTSSAAWRPIARTS